MRGGERELSRHDSKSHYSIAVRSHFLSTKYVLEAKNRHK